MIFCFVDESENRKSDYYLILLGVLVDSNSLFEISFEIEDLKEKFGLKNLKELRNTQRFKQNDKLSATEQLANILRKYDVRFISVIEFPSSIKTDSYNYVRKKLYYDAAYRLSERTTLYARRKNKKWILVADTLKYKEDVFRSIKEKIKKDIREEGETFNLKIKYYLFETPFFVEDELCNFIQVADLVALSLNHALRNYLKEKAYPINIEILDEFSPYLSHYWPLFDKNSHEKVDGWGVKIWWYNE